MSLFVLTDKMPTPGIVAKIGEQYNGLQSYSEDGTKHTRIATK